MSENIKKSPIGMSDAEFKQWYEIYQTRPDAKIFSIADMTIHLEEIKLGTIKLDWEDFGKLFNNFISDGSQMHRLASDDISIFYNEEFNFPGREYEKVEIINGREVAQTVNGLMAAGAKFLDSVIYLIMDPKLRPDPNEHKRPIKDKRIAEHYEEFKSIRNALDVADEKKKRGDKDFVPYIPGLRNKVCTPFFEVFNDSSLLTRCMFFYYFYILIRAKAPTKNSDKERDPIPKFISTVLNIDKVEGDVATYLASFNLNYINPRWVRGIDIRGLSQPTLSRLGLGVAGYRLTSVFKFFIPDGPEASKFTDAIEVAKSFSNQPACWDFHPSTRSPNIMTKYGNINKNCSNLILKVYSQETIAKMVALKAIFQKPVYDDHHTNYTMWSLKDVYNPTDEIFKR